MEFTPDLVHDVCISVYRHGFFLKEIKTPYIIQACYMVAVLMCKDYRIEFFYAGGKHLLAKIRPGIYDEVFPGMFDEE